MFPPLKADLDIRAISGIAGCISIAFWVIVYSPQIIVNFRRQSAEGLSLNFLAIWLAGDVFNVLGAIMQDVIPTMTILALYYTLADIVLLFQCLYYHHHHRKRKRNHIQKDSSPAPSPSSSSISSSCSTSRSPSPSLTHLSPATPLLDPPKIDELLLNPPKSKPLQTLLYNTIAVLMVCLAGILGWYVSNRSGSSSPSTPPAEEPNFSPLGQVFGYICAALYLLSRMPQIILNYRRRSCEGISLLFFLFACLGNLTYVISILAYLPPGETKQERLAKYWKYIGINASWLLGSMGTLGLDAVIFVQFFIYGDEGIIAYESLSDTETNT